MTEVNNEVTNESPLSQEAKEVANLQNRDIKWRARYKEVVSELETVKARSEAEIKSAEQRAQHVLKEKSQIETRWIEAEVKAEAVAAGLSDLDLVKLIDTTNLKVSEDGSIAGLREAILDFKSKKPAFFVEPKKTTSSTNAQMPKEVTQATKSAWDIPKDEYSKNRTRYMAGRF